MFHKMQMYKILITTKLTMDTILACLPMVVRDHIVNGHFHVPFCKLLEKPSDCIYLFRDLLLCHKSRPRLFTKLKNNTTKK